MSLKVAGRLMTALIIPLFLFSRCSESRFFLFKDTKKGFIYDAETFLPIKDAYVIIEWITGPSIWTNNRQIHCVRVSAAKTDSNGEYSVSVFNSSGVFPEFVAYKPGYSIVHDYADDSKSLVDSFYMYKNQETTSAAVNRISKINTIDDIDNVIGDFSYCESVENNVLLEASRLALAEAKKTELLVAPSERRDLWIVQKLIDRIESTSGSK